MSESAKEKEQTTSSVALTVWRASTSAPCGLTGEEFALTERRRGKWLEGRSEQADSTDQSENVMKMGTAEGLYGRQEEREEVFVPDINRG